MVVSMGRNNERRIKTPEQVVAELRALSAQFICPRDTFFASMADVVEKLAVDAARYRFLTRHKPERVAEIVYSWTDACRFGQPDPAVDAAIKQEERKDA